MQFFYERQLRDKSFCTHLKVAFISNRLSRRTMMDATFPRMPKTATSGMKNPSTILETSISFILYSDIFPHNLGEDFYFSFILLLVDIFSFSFRLFILSRASSYFTFHWIRVFIMWIYMINVFVYHSQVSNKIYS